MIFEVELISEVIFERREIHFSFPQEIVVQEFVICIVQLTYKDIWELGIPHHIHEPIKVVIQFISINNLASWSTIVVTFGVLEFLEKLLWLDGLQKHFHFIKLIQINKWVIISQ